jgi:PAS domain S-box-containing protein
LRSDGSFRWVYDHSFPIRDENGALVRTTGIAADITERKQAEIALCLSEEKYRVLMESLDSIVATVDNEGRFLYMNDVAAVQLGGKVEELTGKTMHELFPEPVASWQLEAVDKALSEDKGAIYEAQSAPSSAPNRLRWYRISIQPLHNEAGHVIYALLNMTDIDDLKSTQNAARIEPYPEERIEERTAEVQDLYDNALAAIILWMPRHFIIINQTELKWLATEERDRPSFKDFE